MTDQLHLRHALVDTVLGELTVVAEGDAIVGVYFPEHWYMPAPGRIGGRVDVASDPLLDAARVQLVEYLAGTRRAFDLPTATRGTDLQERVWALLRALPFGTTTTYGALAEQLGNRGLAQGVGQAVGRNPLSIVVPCHRVVGAGGRLTGFAGGLERKRHLLELEAPADAAAARLF